MNNDTILYEHPMNEQTRACLRLEHLFQKAQFASEHDSLWDSRAALAAIINISNLLDRSDLKTKIGKELRRHIDNLSRHFNSPAIDHDKLQHYIDKIERLYNDLQNFSGRIGQNIRDNEFLTSIRQYLFNPGGACSFDIPALHYWLNQSAADRKQDITKWLNEFNIIKAVVNVILEIVRESAIPIIKIAHNGFYQEAIDPKSPCQLIQVSIPKEYNVYPEISSGRHRVSIRFIQPCISEKSDQSKQDIKFSLTYCII